VVIKSLVVFSLSTSPFLAPVRVNILADQIIMYGMSGLECR